MIYQIMSSLSKEGKNIVDTPHYPSWIMFARISTNDNDYPRVITYINAKLISL